MRKTVKNMKNSIVIFLGVKTILWNDACYKITQIVKPQQKTTQKRIYLQGKWSRGNNFAFWPFLCQNYFSQAWTCPTLFYLFNFISSEFCYIFIKNWQKYIEKLFFADIEIFTIVSDIFEHVINQFSKHMEAATVA